MKKEEKQLTSYILGILSIVLSLVQPFAGIVLAIIGLVFIKNQKGELKKKAKTLNLVGLILGIIVLSIFIGLNIYYYMNSAQLGIA